MAASMTAGLMAGCGNSGGASAGQNETPTKESGDTADAGSDSGSSDSEQETTAELDTSEEVELVMYAISDRPAGQDVVDENPNKLLKEKINCTLKINWLGWRNMFKNIR